MFCRKQTDGCADPADIYFPGYCKSVSLTLAFTPTANRFMRDGWQLSQLFNCLAQISSHRQDVHLHSVWGVARFEPDVGKKKKKIGVLNYKIEEGINSCMDIFPFFQRKKVRKWNISTVNQSSPHIYSAFDNAVGLMNILCDLISFS